MIRSFLPVEAKVLVIGGDHDQRLQGAIHYHATIQYQYVAGDKTWVSDQVTAIPVSGDQDWASDIVAKYKAGEPCKAYYNPDNPSEAILLHTHSFSPYMDMLEAAFLVTGGIFVLAKLRATWAGSPGRRRRAGLRSCQNPANGTGCSQQRDARQPGTASGASPPGITSLISSDLIPACG